MRFTVIWKPQAERTLLELWLESFHRDALTRAAEEIESLVRERPESVGESRDLGRRWLFVEPLGVDYSVSLNDRVVEIINVWMAR